MAKQQEHTQPDDEVEELLLRPATPHPALTPRPQRSAQDWSQLADQLGVVPAEEPPKPAPPEAEAAPVVETAAAVFQPVAEPVTPADDARELTEPAAEVPAAGMEPGDTPGEPAENKSGRRRRRRPRGPRRPVEEESAAAAVEDDRPRFAEELFEDTAEEPPSSGEEADSAVADPSASEDEDAQPKSRRRRRRRGSSRKKDPAKKEDASAEAGGDHDLPVVAEESETAQQEGQEPDSAGPRPGKSDAGGRKKEKSAKTSHHAIPNWEEAIGIVISANMESRAKNPNAGSSSRSRGGRGRSGRPKSSEKST